VFSEGQYLQGQDLIHSAQSLLMAKWEEILVQGDLAGKLYFFNFLYSLDFNLGPSLWMEDLQFPFEIRLEIVQFLF
jgi:hypothetical protein